MRSQLFRYSAFSNNPAGGNPAGVWIGPQLPTPEEMQKIATEVGFSETAFIAPSTGLERTIRYYSPETEVSFCGHATIASGVVLGELAGAGTYQLNSAVGLVAVEVTDEGGETWAALTSVEPRHEPAPDVFVGAVLKTLGWQRDEVDMAIPAARAYAGAWHLVLAARTKSRLDDLQYDFAALRKLMLADGLTTVQLIWREDTQLFHARNPFPVGGVVEDPATGAAAAALGGYLRDTGLMPAPTEFVILQGAGMGRPSRLEVKVPATGGIVVRGTAVLITPSSAS
jgi:PhzF family phenazine biosynthesis protein